MQTALTTLLAPLAAYLLGSISFAMIASKIFALADPRTYGSGNPGATNVLRSGNKKAAIFTLLGDALKGWVAVFVAQQLGFNTTMVGLVALAVFFGHLFPVFLKFKGGKGVATAAGVLIALDPLIGLAVLASWIFVAFAFRYSSLAALLAATLAPVYSVLIRGSSGQTLVVGIIAFALIFKHWQNLQRLLAGQESKIGSTKK
ncbi:MAG: glycerol-3-phosphate acyltransferase [Betaproteobacteria bacterium HGW-Betaproteobacteria-10]|nr:MAG: glycerol-3-phosphate acyltransferase [Betaproteobacteria bacterium HGW-Betaproteobacteria-10]